jgi:glycosyltransferase involved in cell wall biosynthesis
LVVRIALIADAYPPLRTSGAVQMRDLAQEFVLQGHEVTVIVPSMGRSKPWSVEMLRGVQVLRLAALPTKGAGYVRRTISEMLLSFAMLLGIRKSPLRFVQWQAAVWYSPSIFLGPLIGALKRSSNCRSYLVLRDIFPEWAVDMGILRKGLVYRFFKLVERYQYSVADIVGVQSAANLGYLTEWARKPGRRLEVLHNWLASAPNVGSAISVANTPLSGRTIFIYAGNMGIAQGMDIVLGLAERLRYRRDIGFMFVGRGSEVPRLKAFAKRCALDNVAFHDEVDPREIPGLLAQCHFGIVALDPRHKTHNVPGKFLAYMQAGLPVLARVNAGNDLAELIEKEHVGRVYVGESLDSFQALALELCDDTVAREGISLNARSLAQGSFSVTAAVRQILSALSLT